MNVLISDQVPVCTKQKRWSHVSGQGKSADFVGLGLFSQKVSIQLQSPSDIEALIRLVAMHAPHPQAFQEASDPCNAEIAHLFRRDDGYEVVALTSMLAQQLSFTLPEEAAGVSRFVLCEIGEEQVKAQLLNHGNPLESSEEPVTAQ